MRACNNNNMRNPSLHLFYYGVMHITIVACPHPLSCYIYTALILCLAAYKYTALIPCVCCYIYIYTALVSLLFGTVIPTSFNILMEICLLPCYDNTLHHCLLSHAHNCLSVCQTSGYIFFLRLSTFILLAVYLRTCHGGLCTMNLYSPQKST